MFLDWKSWEKTTHLPDNSYILTVPKDENLTKPTGLFSKLFLSKVAIIEPIEQGVSYYPGFIYIKNEKVYGRIYSKALSEKTGLKVGNPDAHFFAVDSTTGQFIKLRLVETITII